ncbi:MAG TPA: hypothetical protein VHC39_13915 [Rhizomicrobium sp.]|nr:hypothetical protein [Rhizomicrobium sp.]
MGQSIGSTGNRGKQKGAGDQQSNQPSTRPGQRMSDQETPVSRKDAPDGGADHGPRSAR